MVSSMNQKAIGAVKDQTSIGIVKVASNLALELEVALVMATSHDDEPSSEKYVQEILISHDLHPKLRRQRSPPPPSPSILMWLKLDVKDISYITPHIHDTDDRGTPDQKRSTVESYDNCNARFHSFRSLMDSVTPIHNPSHTAFGSFSGVGAGESTIAMDNPSFSGAGETTTANDSILQPQKRPRGRPRGSKNGPKTPAPPLLETRLRRRETIPPPLETRFINSMAAGEPSANDHILWRVKRPVGRPKGSKNKSKTPLDTRFLNSSAAGESIVVGRVKRPVGRPKGSKNKPKTGLVEINSETTITAETVCYNLPTTPVYNAAPYTPDLVFNESYESVNPGDLMEDGMQLYNNMKQQYEQQQHDRMMNNTNNDEDIWMHLL